MLQKLYLCLLTALLCSAISGCTSSANSNVAEVHGTVTVDGKPVADALISFKPEDSGRNSFGRTNELGQYQLVYTNDMQGAEIGEHLVTISNQPFPGQPKPPVLVPKKFSKRGCLKANVTGGQNNEISFELSSK
ncbi:carboxypeptidase regulatory-like domain-containing protein [bacterium]|nr:carboxypeptidase regulatory-like domain-containing protein [bacterium]